MLVEAVPNLSFGPDEPGLQATLEALASGASPGWALLDVHSDADHRRSVLTMVGAPAPLSRALRTMSSTALAHGDLQAHDGVHPRLGIVDVVPFVALGDAPAHTVNATARAYARWLSGRDVPVHLYGALARDDRRRALPFIRASRKHGDHAAGRPDLGPHQPRPRAGETCVGVRHALVAYNVVLDSDELTLGREIASAVRERDGGLAGVQAMAVQIPSRGGRVQVSMNLVQPFVTGPVQAYAAVHDAARARGLNVLDGEIVGIAPEAFLPDDPADAGLAERPPSLESAIRGFGWVTGSPLFRTT